MFNRDLLVFDEEKHRYYYDGKELISVTQLMQKHGLSPDYSNISHLVLEAKAQRGTLIHKEIEDYIKQGDIGFTTELMEFMKKTKNVNIAESELRVFNDVVAGTCDLLIKQEDDTYIVADIKTTSTLHKEAVSWQLSIYASLVEFMFNYKITKGQAYHFNKYGNLEIIDIPLKTKEEVNYLFESERNHIVFNKPIIQFDLTLLEEVERLIKHYETLKKKAEEQAQEMRKALITAMEDNSVTSFENENIKITYVAPTTRITVDSTRLKKEEPDIYNLYSKESKVKASLRITLKE